MSNHIKLYRQTLVGKQILGVKKLRLTLNDGLWFQLSKPFKGDRLNYSGRTISSLRVIGDDLEIILDNDLRLYLHWKDKKGVVTGPKFPEPGKVRAWEPEEDPEWKEIDKTLDEWEKEIDDATKDG